jgi:hypothetical protein
MGFNWIAKAATSQNCVNFIRETQCDIVGFTEHCLDPTKHHVSKMCYDAVQKYHSRSKLTLRTTPIQTANTYKPGGTLVLSAGNVVCRLSDFGSDDLG